MTVSQDLLKAAEIMEKRGHCRGVPIDHRGRVCALGAIGLATIPDFDADTLYLFAIPSNIRAGVAVRELSHYLGGLSDCRTVYRFNDDQRGWFAKRKVVRALRGAAEEARKTEPNKLTPESTGMLQGIKELVWQ